MVVGVVMAMKRFSFADGIVSSHTLHWPMTNVASFPVRNSTNGIALGTIDNFISVIACRGRLAVSCHAKVVPTKFRFLCVFFHDPKPNFCMAPEFFRQDMGFLSWPFADVFVLGNGIFGYCHLGVSSLILRAESRALSRFAGGGGTV